MPVYTMVKIIRQVWKVEADSFEEASETSLDDNEVEEISETVDQYVQDITSKEIEEAAKQTKVLIREGEDAQIHDCILDFEKELRMIVR